MAKKKADTKRVRMRKLSASPEGVFPAGSERALPVDVAAHLVSSEQADPADERPEPAPEPEPEPAETESGEPEFPRSKGSGWYELSNGETVRGEDEAVEAEAALHEDG